ncbi:hypothetical protein HMI49_36295 [Corallococcus exercitus]|uniref:Uncharacterized protein n=1 Tax=Corallococcus exercitus TaxID=2316736 RepID=A0A7Y4KRU9_9BACT|nr:hypothetical protein [Corallococcus exercitus]NOK38668.1 hypothetical protein [Corallococcus exercitus]
MAVEQGVMAGFSAKEEEQLLRLLHRVVENLERRRGSALRRERIRAAASPGQVRV